MDGAARANHGLVTRDYRGDQRLTIDTLLLACGERRGNDAHTGVPAVEMAVVKFATVPVGAVHQGSVGQRRALPSDHGCHGFATQCLEQRPSRCDLGKCRASQCDTEKVE